MAFDDQALPRGYPFKTNYEVAPRWLADKLAAGDTADLVLVDCRLTYEREFVSLDPSIHIPLHELEDRRDEIEDAVEDAAANSGVDAEVVIFCHHGIRSLKGALTLNALGMPGVKSLAGGLDLWSQAIDPNKPRYDKDGSRCVRID
ncbi:MAG: rhodanese-like domain-containing protein [Planctomycetota bacterium]